MGLTCSEWNVAPPLPGGRCAMCPGDLGHSRHRTVCLDAGLVHKERPWIYCNVFINKSSNLSGECSCFYLSHSNGHCDLVPYVVSTAFALISAFDCDKIAISVALTLRQNSQLTRVRPSTFNCRIYQI